MKQIRLLFSIFLIICSFSACTKNQIDYSDLENWAFYSENAEQKTDVFFIAPTSGKDSSYNMQMNDENYKAAFKGATAMEKGIYDAQSNFYAPFYRQVSLECYELADSQREQYLQKAYDDVENAFDYYLSKINNGRPYIIAGFSQGSDMIKRLFINEKVKGNLVAAYAIGWYFTEDEAQKYSLKMAQNENDVGVIVSFCSESPEYSGNNIIAPQKTLGINPLNWKTDGTLASKEQNKGSCFTNYSGDIEKEIPGLCGAYRDENRGTLKVTDITPKEYPAVLSFLEDGNYHLYDYLFFYRNLQENVQTRIKAFF